MSRPKPLGPPSVARALAEWLLPGDVHGRSVLGDLHEEHNEIAERRGRTAARLWYWRRVLGIPFAYPRRSRGSASDLLREGRHPSLLCGAIPLSPSPWSARWRRS